jgi:hypothetical protein
MDARDLDIGSPRDIPVEPRIMTIADIFDALTASDRSYQKAVHPLRARPDPASARDSSSSTEDTATRASSRRSRSARG